VEDIVMVTMARHDDSSALQEVIPVILLNRFVLPATVNQ